MKRFELIFLCLLLVAALCSCNKQQDTPVVSTPVSDDSGTENSQSTTSATTTTGALVVTDAQGTALTNPDGSLVTTCGTGLPTTIRPVTDPSGSTVTQEDGTNKTEIVVPPHITVSTDAQGTTHTSHVTEHTVTTTTTTATTTETTSTTSSTTSSTTTSSTASTTKPTQQEVAGSVSLPAEGYSPDNRIKLGAVTLSDNVVTMVIRNISPVWEPDGDTAYFEYTCYNKNNGILKVDKIDFGYIPVKSQKICTFEIPENTVKVVLTDFEAEYWSVPV